MTLKEKIQQDLKTALRARKEVEVSTLRMLSAAILNREKEKRYKLSKEKPDLSEEGLQKESFLTDGEIIEVISSEVKKRREAISEFEKGKREELAEKEKKELVLLKKYLPEQLSKQEIKKLAQEIIERLEARDVKDMGKVMGELMPKIKGRAEGGLVSELVKGLLQK